MTRIVFVNLHANEMLVKTASKFVYKQAVAIKHKYWFEYLRNRSDVQICSYINDRGFSLFGSGLSSGVMRFFNLFRFWEHQWVMKKNGIKREEVTVLKHLSDIQPDDILIIYQLGLDRSYDVGTVPSIKVMNMIHFSGDRKHSQLMEVLQPDVMINEANLAKNCKIFQTFYNWCQADWYVYPFVYQERFKCMKPFSERQNKVFSTGTITYKDYPDFLEVYGDACDQPIRKYVKDHQQELQGLIDCYNSDFSENANKKMTVKEKDGKLTRLIKGVYYKFFASQQTSYFSFNMVEKFNDYKMFIIGEEVLGIPGIGFVEGMACGCAYIGQRGYYEDYGMQEGIHYIGYDGTPDDLLDKVRYYQKPEHQEKLEQIAHNGYEFALSHFNGQVIASRLYEELLHRRDSHLSKMSQA